MGEIKDLQKLISDFAKERDWEKFHTPKNLALALGSEVGELLAEFRWKSDDELRNLEPEATKKISYELADSVIFLLRLADILDIDIPASVIEKIKINSERNLKGPDFQKLNQD